MRLSKFEEPSERVHKHEKFGTIYLIPDISCEGCLAETYSGDLSYGEVCDSLPNCGDEDGWTDEAGYIKWLDKVRMK